MKINVKRQKPVRETQMVSLADIAFLIIFFFLLSSTFMTDRQTVALPTLPAVAGKVGHTESAIIVRMDSKDALFLNGEPAADTGALQVGLEELLKNRATAAPEKREVRFLCDRTRPYKKYRAVYDAIANAGGIIAIQHEVPH